VAIPSALSVQPIPAPKSSAVKAGWICIGVGFLTFWIFGFGFVFFSVAMICAVVAMCTNQVQQGLVLLLSSFASLVLCGVMFFVLMVGTIGAIALSVPKKSTPSFGRVDSVPLDFSPFNSVAARKKTPIQTLHATPSPHPR